MNTDEGEDVFELDVQVVTDAGLETGCDTNDGCGHTCQSACNSAA